MILNPPRPNTLTMEIGMGFSGELVEEVFEGVFVY